jgi:4-aminobutyrate aminotransferase-like enzyme
VFACVGLTRWREQPIMDAHCTSRIAFMTPAQQRNSDLARTLADAAEHLPGGNTRTVLHYTPFPLTWASGKGNRLTDLDGRTYLDLLGEYSAGLFGHSNAIIQEALKQAIDDGLVLGGPIDTSRRSQRQSENATLRLTSSASRTPAPKPI